MWLFYPLVFGTVYACMTCLHMYRGHSTCVVKRYARKCGLALHVWLPGYMSACVHMCYVYVRLPWYARTCIDTFFICSCQDYCMHMLICSSCVVAKIVPRHPAHFVCRGSANFPIGTLRWRVIHVSVDLWIDFCIWLEFIIYLLRSIVSRILNYDWDWIWLM